MGIPSEAWQGVVYILVAAEGLNAQVAQWLRRARGVRLMPLVVSSNHPLTDAIGLFHFTLLFLCTSSKGLGDHSEDFFASGDPI